MYSDYYNFSTNNPKSYQQIPDNYSDDRIIAGGFAAPFLLGGLTGALLSPGFYRPYPYPYPYPAPYPRPYYPPYPPYYYRPYRRYY